MGAALATKLGFRFLDSGLVYRVCAVAALENGVELRSKASVCGFAHGLKFSLVPRTGGHEVDDDELRSDQVAEAASLIAQHQPVREVLTAQIRADLAEAPYVVVGRDAGTNIAPEARRKIYLTAAPAVRARRRAAELGHPTEKVQPVMERRDKRDQQRSGVLSPQDDTLVIDTSDKASSRIVETLLAFVELGPTPPAAGTAARRPGSLGSPPG